MSQEIFRVANGTGDVGHAQGWVARATAFLATEWAIGRDLAALERLDGRELADIGLGRGELDHAVRFGRVTARRTRQPFGHRTERASTYADLPVSLTEWR